MMNAGHATGGACTTMINSCLIEYVAMEIIDLKCISTAGPSRQKRGGFQDLHRLILELESRFLNESVRLQDRLHQSSPHACLLSAGCRVATTSTKKREYVQRRTKLSGQQRRCMQLIFVTAYLADVLGILDSRCARAYLEIAKSISGQSASSLSFGQQVLLRPDLRNLSLDCMEETGSYSADLPAPRPQQACSYVA